MKDFAPFAVTLDNKTHVELTQHSSGHLTRVGTTGLGVHILCAEQHIAHLTEHASGRFQRGEGRTDHHANTVFFADFQQDSLDEILGVGRRFIHLPVACDQVFSLVCH